MRATELERIEFGWFGVRVCLDCDLEPLARVVKLRWGALAPPADGAPRRDYRVASDGERTRFEGPGGTVTLDADWPGLHGYNLLFADLLARVGDHFVFHAMSACRGGKGIVISGPSTFGKTTLAVNLAQRGWGLLGDDVAVLERSSGRLLPFTRSLNIRPGTREGLSEDRLEAALGARFDVLRDEWAVDPVAWLGPPPEPASVSMVAVLRPHADGTALRRFPHFEIVVLEGREVVLEELSGLEGVRDVETDARQPRLARVVVDDPTALVHWLREREQDVLSAVKFASDAPDFSGEPRLEPIGPFQAALELAQEMMNRHGGSVLEQEYEGRDALLVADVASALKGARCFALFPGRLERTLEVVEAAFAEVAS